MDRLESQEEKSAKEREKEAEHENHTLVLTEPVPEGHTVAAHYDEEDGQSLLQTIIMVIGAIILVILLVLFARWIYHKVNGSSSAPSGTISQPSEQSNPTNNQSGTNPQSGGQSTPSAGGNSSPQAGSNQNKTITNTGPGNVAAVFAASTLAAAGLHYIISLRRFNKYGD